MWSRGSLGAFAELWPLPVTDDSCAPHLSYRTVKDGNWVAMAPAQSASTRFLGGTLGVGSFALYLLQLLLKWHQALHWIPAYVYPSMYRETESLVNGISSPWAEPQSHETSAMQLGSFLSGSAERECKLIPVTVVRNISVLQTTLWLSISCRKQQYPPTGDQ